MRFKLFEEYDYNNQEITQETAEYFKDSKIRLNGKLVVLKHGTDSDPFLELKSSKLNTLDNGYFGRGFYLTMSSEYAQDYGGNIMEFYANICNPFYINNISENMAEKIANYILNHYDFENNCLPCLITDAGKKYNNIESYIIKHVANPEYKQIATDSKEARESKRVLPALYLDKYRNMFKDLIQNPDYMMDGLLHDFQTFDTVIRENGYDGVVYSEGDNPFYEVVVYNSNQLKFITNRTPTSSYRFNESVLGDLETIKQTLTNNFSTKIDYDLPSSVIFRDGTIISGQCHPDLVDCLADKGLVEKPKDSSGADLFAKDLNCVRLTMDGALGENYIAIPKESMTGAQRAAVEKWLEEAMLHLDWVDVCTDYKPSVHSNDKCRYEMKEDSDVRNVIGKIRKFYSTGTLEPY